MPQSVGQQKLEKLKNFSKEQFNGLATVYSDDQLKAYNFYLEQFEHAKAQRSQRRTEFDGLTYEQDYELNKRAANAFLRPKKNDSEVRVNTGTTEKKVEAIQNELLSMNLQHEVMAFDYNDTEIVGLGNDMSAIVKRTNEIEQDEDKMVDFTQELLVQRAVFIEETFNYRTVDDRRRSNPRRLDQRVNDTKKNTYTIGRAEKNVLSGLQVYLGDINIPSHQINKQPFIVKYERMSYAEAATIYGEWDMWKYVMAGNSNNQHYHGAFNYRMNPVQDREVEILHYMSYPDDEYQIIINGVMMLPIPAALPWEQEGYNIRMITIKPMGRDFAYGKQPVASSKTIQGLENETIRNMVRKFQQALEPPLAVEKEGVYSRDIWNPGSITQGLKAGQFESLIKHQGITDSEYKFYEIIKQTIQEFIGASNILQGLPAGKDITATEALEVQKQALKQLGLAVLAYMRMRREMTILRIYNVLQNYLDPIDKQLYQLDKLTTQVGNVYRRFTIKQANFGGGKRGTKIVQFTDRDMQPDEMQKIKAYEDQQDMIGKPVRFSFINTEKLRKITAFWQVAVVSKPRDGSQLQQILFKDKITQGYAVQQLTGRRMNPDKLVEEFETTWQTGDLFEESYAAEQNQQFSEEQAMNDPNNPASKLLKKIGELESTPTDGVRPNPGASKVNQAVAAS